MRKFKIKGPFIEALAYLACLGILIYVLRGLLIFGTTSLPHDHLYWGFASYKFYAENILSGNVPLWDPFTHGGEAFYPELFISRLIGPLPLIITIAGSFFTSDAVVLYSWHIFIHCLVLVTGAYLVFRRFADDLLTRLLLIPVAMFSSMMFMPFHQVAGINHIVFVPYILLFMLKIAYWKEDKWRNWLMLAALIGLNWESYYFVGSWFFMFLLIIFMAVFRFDLIRDMYRRKGFTIKFAASSAVILIMLLPNLAVMRDTKKFVYPARMKSDNFELLRLGAIGFDDKSAGSGGLFLSYAQIAKSGAFSSPWDTVQMLSPDANKWLLGSAALKSKASEKEWGKPSEAYMYAGLLPLALAIFGLCFGKHDLKKTMAFMLACFWLLSMGPVGGLHRILYYVFPPLWFMRNMHAFSGFFIFLLMYFFVLGMNRILGAPEKKAVDNRRPAFMFMKTAVSASVMAIGVAYALYMGTAGESGYFYLYVIGCAIAGYAVLRFAGRSALFFGLMIGITASAVYLGKYGGEILLRMVLYAIVPLALFALARAFSNKRSSGFIKALAMAACVLSISYDMVTHASAVSYLYEGQPHPALRFGMDTGIKKPKMPDMRYVFPKEYWGQTMQPIRYVSQMESRPYVFSTIKITLDSLFGENITQEAMPNYSFEKWVKKNNFADIPEGFSISNDRGLLPIVGYSTDKDECYNGKRSILVYPSKSGANEVSYSIDVSRYSGQMLRAVVMAKSANTAASAIKLMFRDKNGEVTYNTYGNMGIWEGIDIEKIITPDTKKLNFVMRVENSADAPVFFDFAHLWLGTAVTDMDYARTHFVWDVFHMFRNYFSLVYYSGLPSEALNESFAVWKPLIQFRRGALPVDENGLSALFEGASPESVSMFMGKYVLLDKAAINGAIMPLALAESEFAYLMKNTGKSGESGFTYSIKSYDFSSLHVRAEADKTGLLYWADGHDEYWRAYVDGKETPVYRANVNFKAVVVPKGGHDIKFIYRPVFFLLSMAVFYGAFLACFMFALVSRIRRG